MQQIRKGLGDCPTFLSHVDTSHLRTTAKLFQSYFPHHVEVRNAIDHAGEVAANPDRHSVDGFSGPGISAQNVKGLMIVDSIMGRNYTTTINGAVLQYELSQDTLDKIISVVTAFYRGFERAEQFSESKMLEIALKPRGPEPQQRGD